MRKLTVVLIALMFGCLAAPASGDEATFLPEGQHFFLSLNVSTFLKSKTFAEVKKKSAPVARKIVAGFEDDVGIAGDNIERIVMGAESPNDNEVRGIIMVTTRKPVLLADIKKKLKPAPRNAEWKEVQVAGFTVHLPDGDPVGGSPWQPFCIAEERIVLKGTLASIKTILERKNATNLAAGMRAGLKEAGSDQALVIVIDVQRYLAERMENKLPGELLPFPIPETFKGVNVIVVKAQETDRFAASVTMICKDAAAAAAVQQSVASGHDLIKTMSNPDNVPRDQRERNKTVFTLLEAVKISRTDNRVVATMTVEPAAVADLLHAIATNPAPKQ